MRLREPKNIICTFVKRPPYQGHGRVQIFIGTPMNSLLTGFTPASMAYKLALPEKMKNGLARRHR